MPDKSLQKKSWGDIMVGYIPMKIFLPLLIVCILGIIFNVVPSGFLGAYMLCSVLGILLDQIGNVTPIVKTYLGGGSFVAIFGAAIIAYFGIMPEKTSTLIVDFVKSMDYIGWVVAALICGSILAMDRNLLIRAGVRYFIPVLGGIAGAFALTGVIGAVSGYGWRQAILFIALPIMGGGTSAGAVPTAAAYGEAMSQGSDYYLTIMMPAVVIGNALAVVAAGVLKGIGNKMPSTTGHGQLMRNTANFSAEEAPTEAPDLLSMGRGFIISGTFFGIGRLINLLVPSIHYYAWTIIACAVCNIFKLVPEQMAKDCRQWYNFLMKVSVPCVLFSIGFVYTDLATVIENMSLTYLLLVTATLVGCILATWFISKLVGFYPVEGAITSGLCMANMGGSRDIATLGAAGRMERQSTEEGAGHHRHRSDPGGRTAQGKAGVCPHPAGRHGHVPCKGRGADCLRTGARLKYHSENYGVIGGIRGNENYRCKGSACQQLPVCQDLYGRRDYRRG